VEEQNYFLELAIVLVVSLKIGEKEYEKIK